MTAPIRFDDIPITRGGTNQSVSFDDIPMAAVQAPTPPSVKKPTPSLSTMEEAIGLIRSLGQGALLGFGEELEALRYAVPGGLSPAEGLEQIRREMTTYRGARPGTALGAELVGGLATGVAGGARALATGAGRRAAGALLGSAVGQGVVGGAGAAEGGVENRLKGAALGGTVAAALPYVGGKAVRVLTPAARQIGQAAQAGYDVTRRGVANLLEGTPMQRFGRAIEPTDITRIQREATTLPGGVTGPTAAMMPGGTDAAVQAVRQAEAAAARAQQQVKSARLATGQATQARTEALERVKAEEGARIAEARQQQRTLGAQAEKIERIGKGRRELLSTAAKTAEEEAKAVQRGVTAEVRQSAAATREQAKTAAQQALEEARAEATEALGTMRGAQPRGTAKRLQEAVRSRQIKEAQGHYAAVRALGAPPELDPGLYKEIADNATLRNALEGAVESLQRETRNLPPGAAMPSMRTVSVDNVEFPEITLEMMDRLRRKVMEPQMRKGPNVVGLSRSQKAEALETINRLEERYLAGFGSDEAAEALRTARSAYRERFQVLEAVQDGLNLGTTKAGKASGLLTQSRKELDEVATRVENMTPKQQAAFRVGAREWFDRVIQENPADALKIAQKFSSEASQRRLALAYGDEAVASLRAFAPDVLGKRQAAAAARVREEGQQLAQQIVRRGEEAATPLTARAERARALAERARTQATERAQTLREESLAELEGRRQAGQLRLTETQQAAGVPVRQAREAQRAAEEQAAQLAEQLTQARIARSQAKALPMGDLERALGSSTAQQTFLQRTLPQMTPAQRTQAVEVLGSNVQRRLQDLARQGESPERILQEINQLKQNDAVRQLFGPQMDAFAASLFPTMGTRFPGAVRPAITGALARTFGQRLSENKSR